MRRDIFFDPDSHIYLVDGVEVPSVTEILKPLSNRGYAKINQAVLDYAAARGTAVHEACEAIDLGAEPEIVPEIQGYINAYLEWKNIYRPTWLGVEKIVCNEFGGYIGTLDRVGYFNGGDELCIVDLKTSNPTKEALVSVCLQTAAYMLAFNADIDEPNVASKRYGLFLKSDGTFRLQDCDEYEKKYQFDGFESFRKLLYTHNMVSELLKTGKGKNNE